MRFGFYLKTRLLYDPLLDQFRTMLEDPIFNPPPPTTTPPHILTIRQSHTRGEPSIFPATKN